MTRTEATQRLATEVCGWHQFSENGGWFWNTPPMEGFPVAASNMWNPWTRPQDALQLAEAFCDLKQCDAVIGINLTERGFPRHWMRLGDEPTDYRSSLSYEENDSLEVAISMAVCKALGLVVDGEEGEEQEHP